MAIGVVNCLVGITDRERLGIGLSVCPVIGTGNHGEVAHLMDESASLGIGTSCWCSPEDTTQIDVVGLIGIDISVNILLLAGTVEFHRLGVHGAANGGIMTLDCVVS